MKLATKMPAAVATLIAVAIIAVGLIAVFFAQTALH